MSVGSRPTLRRRVERAQAKQNAHSASSSGHSLTDSLRKHWAKGTMSSPTINELAMGGTSQGARGQSIERIGRAARPDNLQRMYLNLFGNPPGVPQFTYAPLPFKSGNRLHPLIMPHKLFSQLYHHKREYFDQFIRGPENAALQFWNDLRGTAIWNDVSGQLNTARLHLTLPIGMHGDGGGHSINRTRCS